MEKITNLKEFNKNGKVLVFEDEDKYRKYLFISKIYNNQNKKYFLDGDYLYNALDFFIVPYCGEPLDDQLIAIINIDNFTYKNKDITEFSDKQWLLFNNWMQNRYTENSQIDFVDLILDFDGLNFFNKKKKNK